LTTAVLQAAARAERAETHLARVARLRSMTGAELAALFAQPDAAAPWVEAAAACGIPEAQVRLGRMRLAGEGVARDEAAALRWFLKAARAGHADAQNMAGRAFELGWGCAIDLVAAARWYARAAAGGHAWGEYNHANLLFDGRGVAKDRAAAFLSYARAARQGHARAMNLLARCLEEGWGTARDSASAAEWYRRSAEAGYFRAQYNHAIELLRRGRREEAAVWLERARAEADGPLLEQIDRLLVRFELQRPAAKSRQIPAYH